MVLQADPGGPNDIALDQEFVYWANYSDGRVQRIRKGGGQAEYLVDSERLIAHYLAVDGDRVYFNDRRNSISSVLKTGGPATTVVVAENGPESLRAREGRLCWTTSRGTPTLQGGVVCFSLTSPGAVPVVVADGYVGVGRLAFDDRHVYFSAYGNPNFDPTAGGIYRVSLSGGSVTTLARGLDSPWGIWIDEDNVYFAEGFHVRFTNNVANGTIKMVPKTSDGNVAPVVLASNQASIMDLSGDSGNLYWITQYPEQIVRGAKAPGIEPVVLATKQPLATALAVDDDAVFWVNFSLGNGGVVKVAK